MQNIGNIYKTQIFLLYLEIPGSNPRNFENLNLKSRKLLKILCLNLKELQIFEILNIEILKIKILSSSIEISKIFIHVLRKYV
jgi:hypothetical protein